MTSAQAFLDSKYATNQQALHHPCAAHAQGTYSQRTFHTLEAAGNQPTTAATRVGQRHAPTTQALRSLWQATMHPNHESHDPSYTPTPCPPILTMPHESPANRVAAPPCRTAKPNSIPHVFSSVTPGIHPWGFSSRSF